MKSLLGRTWRGISYAIGGYMIYKKLQQLDEAKNDFYAELPPEMKSKWDEYFGHPGPVEVVNPMAPSVRVQPSTIEQVKAGT